MAPPNGSESPVAVMAPPQESRGFQFSLKTLLLSLAFVGITAGANSFLFRQFLTGTVDQRLVLEVIALCSPLWTPAVFLAYAIGRRRISGIQMLVFGLVQVIALGALWAFRP